MPPQRNRGPYKRYLWDANASVPRTTAYRRRLQARMQLEESDEDLEEMPEVGPESDDELGPLRAEEEGSFSGGSSWATDSSNESLSGESSDQNGDDSDAADSNDPNSDYSLSDSEGSDDLLEIVSEADYNEFHDVEIDEHLEEDGRHSPLQPCREAQPPQVDLPREENNMIVIEDENINRPRVPLYNGCPVTSDESALLIMSFVIRWGLQDKCIEDLLCLMDCHLPHKAMGSKYQLLKRFPTPPHMKVRYFCPNCSKILPGEFTDGQCECGHDCNVKELRHQGDYYIELSIAEQIKNILDDRKLYQLLRRDCEERDVVQGSVYRNLRATGVIGEHDLTLQWNTDGVKPFKSSKVSMWPIQACINELPYQARRDNMILCGLYYGKKKPSVNSFLMPFVEELQTLHEDGLEWQRPGQDQVMTVRVHTIVSAVDSVARAPLQGLKQYNGRYGCSFCLRRGTQIMAGRGHARVYPGRTGVPRTAEQHINAIEALQDYNRTHVEKKKHIQGVRYASAVLLIPVFDIISSFSADFLHSALEGTVKTFLKFWGDSTNEGKEWYLTKQKRDTLNERLKTILPCKEITRVPRSTEDIALWKASEFLNFLLYFSVVSLQGLLPQKYINHWFLFVYSMNIFVQESFSDEEFEKAKAAITKFVFSIPTVYTDCFRLCTFNCHLLLHFPEAVKRFGGLWAASTFPFEHYNGILTKLITGTQYVPQQICRSFLRVRQVSAQGREIFSVAGCPEPVIKLYNSLFNRYYSHASTQYDRHLRLFGKAEAYSLSLVERVAVQNHLQMPLIEINTKSFRRLILKGVVFHASHYNTLRVRDNSIVCINGTFMSIQRILLVRPQGLYQEHCVLLGERLEVLPEELCRDRELRISSNSLIKVCRRSGTIIAQSALNLKKCMQISYNDKVCVVPLCNSLVRD